MAYTNYGLTKGLAYQVPWMQMVQLDEQREERRYQRAEREKALQMQQHMWLAENAEFQSVGIPYLQNKLNNFYENEALPELHSIIEQDPNYMYNPNSILRVKQHLHKLKDNDIVTEATMVQEHYQDYREAVTKNPDIWRSDEAINYRDNYRSYINQQPGDNIPVPRWHGSEQYDWMKNIQTNFSKLTMEDIPVTLPSGKPGYRFYVTDQTLNDAAQMTYDENPMFWDNFFQKTAFKENSVTDLIKRLGRNYIKPDKYSHPGGSGFTLNLGGRINKEAVPFYENEIVKKQGWGSPSSTNKNLIHLVNKTDKNQLYKDADVWMALPEEDVHGNKYGKINLPSNYEYQIENTKYIIQGTEQDEAAGNLFVMTDVSVDLGSGGVNLGKMINIYKDIFDIDISLDDQKKLTGDDKQKAIDAAMAIAKEYGKTTFTGTYHSQKYGIEFEVALPLLQDQASISNYEYERSAESGKAYYDWNQQYTDYFDLSDPKRHKEVYDFSMNQKLTDFVKSGDKKVELPMYNFAVNYLINEKGFDGKKARKYVSDNFELPSDLYDKKGKKVKDY